MHLLVPTFSLFFKVTNCLFLRTSLIIKKKNVQKEVIKIDPKSLLHEITSFILVLDSDIFLCIDPGRVIGLWMGQLIIFIIIYLFLVTFVFLSCGVSLVAVSRGYSSCDAWASL